MVDTSCGAVARSDNEDQAIGTASGVLRRIRAELLSQAGTLNFKLEWAGFVLSAFGAYMLSYGNTSGWTWTAWAAWLVANTLGACFGYRCRHYGYALQSLVFIPSSLHGLMLTLGVTT